MKKILIMFVYLMVLNFLMIPKADATLIGYWNFNEGTGNVAHDSSGFGNDGTGLDATWIPGKYGYATNSDKVTVPPDASLLPSSNLTISAWVRIGEFNGLQRRIAEMEYRYGLLFNPPNIDLETPFLFNINSENFSFEFQDPEIGEWFHAAVSWDGSIAQFYYNGVPAPPVAVSGAIDQTGSVPLYMGREGYTLDEVRIYNTALNQDEIIRDMNFDSTVIPEPSTMLLLGAGLLGGVRLRKRVISV